MSIQGREDHSEHGRLKETDKQASLGYGSIPRSSNGRGLQDDSDDFRTRSALLPDIAIISHQDISSLDANGDSKRYNNRKAGNISSTECSEKFPRLTGQEDTEVEIFCCGLTKRQFQCAFALCLLSVVDVMGFGIFAPFFPLVAEEKGLTQFQIGLVFAAFSTAGIFASIFTGALLVRVGAKFIVIAGLFWSAGSIICFGFLDKSPSDSFFYLCFACRLLMGFGSTGAFTALFAVIFQEFSDRALTIIGISESLCAVGGIISPLIGGALYVVGGFLLPFTFLGCLQLLAMIVAAVMIPHVEVERQANAVSPAWLLINPHGLFSALFVILSFAVISFITSNISLFLTHSFNLSPFMVGVFLLISSVFYGIATPIVGYISDSKKIGASLMAGGCLLGGLVLSLYGPAVFWLNLFGWTAPHKWLVILCSGLHGALMAGIVMPTFGEMVVAADQMKLHSNKLAEYGLVSGLWNMVYSVGDIIGPSVGGVMVEKFGFGNSGAILGLIMVALALAKTVHLVVLRCKDRNQPPGGDRDEENSNEYAEEQRGLLTPDNSLVTS